MFKSNKFSNQKHLLEGTGKKGIELLDWFKPSSKITSCSIGPSFFKSLIENNK